VFYQHALRASLCGTGRTPRYGFLHPAVRWYGYWRLSQPTLVLWYQTKDLVLTGSAVLVWSPTHPVYSTLSYLTYCTFSTVRTTYQHPPPRLHWILHFNQSRKQQNRPVPAASFRTRTPTTPLNLQPQRLDFLPASFRMLGNAQKMWEETEKQNNPRRCARRGSPPYFFWNSVSFLPYRYRTAFPLSPH
jgi:hypothetical protein